MINNVQVEILLVEDSATDQAIVREAFKSSGLSNRLHVVSNGEEAMAFLKREGPFSLSPAPDLILLDINMPRKDGRETLAEIKQHDRWKFIPVIVLTSSQAERDIMDAYRLHANCYIVKPIDFDEIVKVVHAIDNFWFSTVKLPQKDSAEGRFEDLASMDGALETRGAEGNARTSSTMSKAAVSARCHPPSHKWRDL
jgi:CheY-like chemotaxis protein